MLDFTLCGQPHPSTTCDPNMYLVKNLKTVVLIFEKEIELGKCNSAIGPVVLITTSYVTLDASINGPALSVELTVSGMVNSSFDVTVGYSKSNGAFDSVDHSIDPSFTFPTPTFPRSDSRLSAECAISV